MNIYLDESYNLEKHKGRPFISISGFAITDDKTLRKRWRAIRKPYTKSKQRIHATNSHFEDLRKKSIKLLGRYDATILTIFQLITELPSNYFINEKIDFDTVYSVMLENLFLKLPINTYKNINIIIDSRNAVSDALMETFLTKKFAPIVFNIKAEPSYMNILLELADFISNTLYKEYKNEAVGPFKKIDCKIIQIKNPL